MLLSVGMKVRCRVDVLDSMKLADVYEGLRKATQKVELKFRTLDYFYAGCHIEMLKVVDSGFFQLAQECTIHDLAMSLGRLLDPAKQGSFRNLSLELLVMKMAGLKDATLLRDKLDAFLDGGVQAKMGTVRNKREAHRDVQTYLDDLQKGAATMGIGPTELRLTVEFVVDFMEAAKAILLMEGALTVDMPVHAGVPNPGESLIETLEGSRRWLNRMKPPNEDESKAKG